MIKEILEDYVQDLNRLEQQKSQLILKIEGLQEQVVEIDKKIQEVMRLKNDIAKEVRKDGKLFS